MVPYEYAYRAFISELPWKDIRPGRPSSARRRLGSIINSLYLGLRGMTLTELTVVIMGASGAKKRVNRTRGP